MLGKGQKDGETGAFAEFGLDRYLSLVRIDDSLDIAQAQAKALYVVNVAGRDTIKAIKDLGDVGFGNALSLIKNVDADTFFYVIGLDGDFGTAGGVFVGVIEKPRKDIAQVQEVSFDAGLFGG